MQSAVLLKWNELVWCLQVDHWLEFSARRLCGRPDLTVALGELDKALSLRTFLVGHALTLADLSIWAALKGQFYHQHVPVCIPTCVSVWNSCSGITDGCCFSAGHEEWPNQGQSFSHVNRWFSFLSLQVPFTSVGSKYSNKNASVSKSKVCLLLTSSKWFLPNNVCNMKIWTITCVKQDWAVPENT